MERNEPIAIIGIGCRFPGGADDPRRYWKLMRDGIDAVTEVPADRWSVAEYFHPVPGTPGKTYSRWGGFLAGIDGFEPEAFGISPREAAYMDPQQRLLLEVASEALEDGGQVVERLAGTPTGVFVGISTSDYSQIQSSLHERSRVEAHAVTGGALSIAAGRISYCLNLQGPSLAVDTACSSALVATHLACQSLRTGECDLALAGGVNVIISPGNFVGFSAASMLSATGRCKAFDASADGFVRGEGAGMVLLKPLDRAVADGDPVYAVILATAVNQDGRTAGIAAPSRSAQESLLLQAYRKAGVATHRVHYVEAHGTGTAIGDPIEAGAIGAVLSTGRDPERPCVIGSVKTNIGHLEAAAGVAGLIKAALAVWHRAIPGNLHFREPNPAIPFGALALRVPTVIELWPDDIRPAVAGVNSFGFGGTNAHVVIAEHPTHGSAAAARASGERPGACLLPLSARTPEALVAVAGSLRDRLREEPAMPLADLCYTASSRRTHFDHRLALIGDTPEAIRERLDAFVSGERRGGTHQGRRRQPPPRLVGVFSGQGPQWWAMGRQLLHAEPVFRRAIEECHALLSRHADWSLLAELTADEPTSRLGQTRIAQPALFALQVALTALWRSWGVEFDAVLGHSVGEIAAAHAAGALDLAEAARVIYHRGRAMDRASSKGRMLAVELSRREAEQVLAGHEAAVTLAAVNGPTSTTLSGDPAALEAIARALEARGVFHRFLAVEYAFHSAQMDPVRDELLTALGPLDTRAPGRVFASTVTGEIVTDDALGPEYWWQNVRQPVLFGPAVDRLLDQGLDVFVEVGPHPVLSGAVSQCLAARGRTGAVLASLRRQEDERGAMLSSLGALYTLGHPIDWRRQWPGGGRCIHLPAYPWQRQRHWHESDAIREMRLESGVHPLLGRRRDAAEPSWEVSADLQVLGYLGHHRVQGQVVFPAAAYVEQAFAVAGERLGPGPCVVEDLEFPKPLFFPEDGPVRIQTAFHQGEAAFSIHSQTTGPDASWTLHATGTIRTAELTPDRGTGPEQLRAGLPELLKAEAVYAAMASVGLDFGPSFRRIERVWRRDGEALGRIGLHQDLVPDVDGYRFHPALLDGCLQVVGAALPAISRAEGPRLYLPARVERVRLYRNAPARVWSHVRLTHASANTLVADIRVLDDEGDALAEITGLLCQAVEWTSAATRRAERSLWSLQWHHKPLAGEASVPREAAGLPRPADVAAAVRPEIEEAAAKRGWPVRLPALTDALDRLASAYIVRALDELGWSAEIGTRIGLDALATALSVAPRHRMLLRRFLQALEGAGCLTRAEPDGWDVRRALPREDPAALWRETLLEHGEALAELTMVAAAGSRLPEILRGEVDPLHVLFPDGSTAAADHLFQDSPALAPNNAMVQRLVCWALAALPTDGVVRVLEVGAGTGGLTSYVLPELPGHRAEYVFSDVSPFFLARAEAKFRDAPFVRFQPLDIERDPLEQGYTRHGFDLILAANVLHATRDVREALGHAVSLLAPGGLLVLIETDEAGVWPDLVFGITDGWWRFRDRDLRPEHPLLARDAWQTLLAEHGCTDVTCLALPLADGRTSAEFVLLAQGPALVNRDAAAAVPARPAAALGTWMIFADGGGVGARLAERLEAGGDACWVVMPGDAFRLDADRRALVSPDRLEDMQRLLESVIAAPGTPPFRGAIHLWSLNAAPPLSTTLESLQRAEALGCHAVMHLVQAFERSPDRPEGVQLALVTRGAQPLGGRPVAFSQAPLVGVGRTLLHEYPAIRTKLVDLDPNPSPGDIDLLLAELWTDDLDEEVALRRGARFVPRLERIDPDAPPAGDAGTPSTADRAPYRLESPGSGVLGQLAFRTASRQRPGPGQVEIEVAAAALNFRDVLKTLRLLPADMDDSLALGDECAGTVIALGEGVTDLAVGDEVVAIALGAFASHVTTAARLAVRKPARLTFAEAVGLPVAFLTAYYSLHHLARIGAGDQVLIHAAAGGVGLAAVQLARRAGATVWATAGSPDKRALLARLGVHRVMDSRSLAFFDQIMQETNGRGVDIVLNSLAGPALAKSMACLALGGRFLEIGKRDIYGNTKIGLKPFRRYIAFFAVDIAPLIFGGSDVVPALLGDLQRDLETRAVRPLPHRVVPATRIAEAFRHMAQARHVGKLVVWMSGQRVRPAPGRREPEAFRADATYLIAGGLGGFGLVVARWIVERGGRHLALIGRSGAATAEARDAVEALRASGARVEVIAADIASESGLAAALDRIRRTMPPIRGVFQAAMVLDDDLLIRLDPGRFRRVTAPKVDGTWNLHVQTLSSSLDYFVLFSSFATMIGPPGQANYAAANLFLEAVAAHRRTLGLPGIAISWGPLGEVGYVARHPEIAAYFQRLGSVGLTPAEAIDTLEQTLASRPVHVGVVRADLHRWVPRAALGKPAERWRSIADGHGRGAPAHDTGLQDALRHASPEERETLVRGHVLEQVARVLGAAPSSVGTDRPLDELGLDSLMAIELKNHLESNLGLTLPMGELMRVPSVETLAQAVLRVLAVDAKRGDRAPGLAAPASVGRPALVQLRAGASARPLFCLHPAGGQVGAYRALADKLPVDQAAYGIASRLVTGAETEHGSLEEMARAYAAIIRERHPRGPYQLLGFSFGGFVALAVAAVLEEQGARVEFIGLVDCDPHWIDSAFSPTDALQTMVASTYDLLQQETGVLPPLGREEANAFTAVLLGSPPDARGDAAVGWLVERHYLPPDLPIPLAREYVATHIARVEAHLRLLPAFRPKAVLAPIAVWHARDGLAGSDGPTGGWGAYSRAGAVEGTIEGTHYAVMAEPHVSELGRQLRARLESLQAASPVDA
jgi:acyl transferase domain-containing protein/NADPH:quinone reductase-like Zn-dependent oxidoreductase/thioesterase domain-containing protein/SAM-dependent methyltransferase/acyl carrier protein/NADP-dependent 3-hydroxy acid dehydrogenase YdfG